MPSRSDHPVRLAVAALCAASLAIAAASGCADEDAAPSGDPGPIHVHGLGVNPADSSLYIATHTGLFRMRAGVR